MAKDKRRIVTKTVHVKATDVPATKDKKGYHREGYTKKIKDISNQKMGFDKLAKEVAKGYEGKKVPKKYQSEYGKRYSKEEAKEVGRKVAGKVRAGIFKKKHAKMSLGNGGSIDGTNFIITGKHKI